MFNAAAAAFSLFEFFQASQVERIVFFWVYGRLRRKMKDCGVKCVKCVKYFKNSNDR
jgi:hypothetical protein